MTETEPMGRSVRQFVRSHLEELIADLSDWVRIPSVGADPAHDGDVEASAAWLAAAFARAGVPQVELWPTGGHPAVYAHWPHPDPAATRVLVYGHHDVQPADAADGWSCPPFDPIVKDGCLFGRGSSDDKGQIAYHLLGLRAHCARQGESGPAVDLAFLIEGEEESGSTHFAELLAQKADVLRPDVIVVSDSTMAAATVPSTCVSLRGIACLEVTVSGAAVDLHSGSFGGAVPNPVHVLADLIARMHDENGRIAIPGFYDAVIDPSPAERELMAAVPFDEDEWLREVAGAPMVFGEAGFTTPERIGARPTAEVNGIWGGYTGPGSKIIVPSQAAAKITFRLVAGQDPQQISELFASWARAVVPSPMGLRVEIGDGARPCSVPADHPAVTAVRAAIGRAVDKPVAITREGGSGPEAALAEILDAPVVFLGFSLPTDRFHSPDERMSIDQLAKGAEAAAYLWEELEMYRRQAQ